MTAPVKDEPAFWSRISVAGLGLALTLAATVAGFYYRTQAHADDHVIHLEPAKVVEGGGVAFRHDVETLREDIHDEMAKMRSAINHMVLTCQRTITGELTCRVDLPAEER